MTTSFFDAKNQPVHDLRGTHAIEFTYDDAGETVDETLFDVHGRPVTAKPMASR
jgi:YD repeat-containing protein